MSDQTTVALNSVQNSAIQALGTKAGALKNAKATGINLVADYLKLTAGEQIRGFYVGETTIIVTDTKNEPSELICAKIIAFDEHGNSQMKLAGQSQLRNALKVFNDATPIEITNLGQKDLGGGKKMELFRVELLEL